MTGNAYHIPVLLKETLDILITDPDGTYLDCTLGGGGHAYAILNKISDEGYLLGIDRDAEAIAKSGEVLSGFSNFRSENISFSKINELEKIVFGMKFNGILLDIGVSSKQIDDASRGFSYSQDGPLDMRMDKCSGMSAFDIINGYDQEQLADIFFRFGEEKRSRSIASKICRHRMKNEIRTTNELASVISSAVSGNFRIKTLSRIFQALRIEVNAELAELEAFLNLSTEILKSGGRVGVISYHSLEDRIVKNFINKRSGGCICPPGIPRCICNNQPVIKKITKKAVTASEEEININSRSRSAKLRVFELI